MLFLFSINIPYIKGTPEEGGTHGIIGQDIIRHFKPDAVLLNFARGELVDSAAMKTFLDQGSEGRYISDFPDDELWDHENAVILPHLGASTEEAEDQAVRIHFCLVQICRCKATNHSNNCTVGQCLNLFVPGINGSRNDPTILGTRDNSPFCELP